MKVLIFLLLATWCFGQTQIVHKGLNELFEGTAVEDSIVISSYNKVSNKTIIDYYIRDSVASTISSRMLDNRKASGALYVTGRVDSVRAGTISTVLEMGLYRGYSVDNPDGFEYKAINRTAADAVPDSFKVVISDSTWWLSEPTTMYYYRWTPTGTQGLNYRLHEFKYEEE